MSHDPYIYPGTDVLKNKYDIRDLFDLKEIETDYTNTRLAELHQNPIKGNYDLNHLKAIHKHLFQDLYDWAGELRTISMEKGFSTFTNQEDLETTQKAIFDKLQSENYLKGLPTEQFAIRAAEYLGEINRLHPFREGNGRTQREFIRELALETGHQLDLANIPKTEMLEASFNYNQGNPEAMRNLTLKQILKTTDANQVAAILERHDRHQAIETAKPRPEIMTRCKIKNPDIANEYLNLAKEILKREGKWPGVKADREIAGKLLANNYPKFKIENAINYNSIETAHKPPTNYAKQLVKEVAKSLTKDIER